MDLLKAIASAETLRTDLVGLYQAEKKDVESGRLDLFQFGKDSIKFEGECLLKIYAISYYLRELVRQALKDDSIFLEQTPRERFEEMEKSITTELEGVEKNVCERLYRGYEASW